MATPQPTSSSAPRSRIRTLTRLTGTVLLVSGLGLIVWALVVWQWNDPFTATYTRWQQHRLSGEHEKIVAEFRPTRPLPKATTRADEAAAVARAARRFRVEAAPGAPIGRIVVPRLHLRMLMVNGTDSETLKRGPGRDERTFMPGQGKLVYIAGHRTTYLAPFSDIEKMRPGDRVTLDMPYAAFTYAVTGHSIVDANDLSVLTSRGKEIVALQACHPRFRATQRYLVWAKLIRVSPANGLPYTPSSARSVRPA